MYWNKDCYGFLKLPARSDISECTNCLQWDEFQPSREKFTRMLNVSANWYKSMSSLRFSCGRDNEDKWGLPPDKNNSSGSRIASSYCWYKSMKMYTDVLFRSLFECESSTFLSCTSFSSSVIVPLAARGTSRSYPHCAALWYQFLGQRTQWPLHSVSSFRIIAQWNSQDPCRCD